MDEDKFLKCIVDPNRRRLLELIGPGEKCVSELVEETGMEQSLVSHHLRSLKDCGLVRSRQHGRKVLYEVSSPDIVDVLNRIREISGRIEELAKARECL